MVRQRNTYSSYEDIYDYSDDDEATTLVDGRAWTNTEGERLEDFGVDTTAERFDEDDVPLSQLIHNKTHAYG